MLDFLDLRYSDLCGKFTDLDTRFLTSCMSLHSVSMKPRPRGGDLHFWGAKKVPRTHQPCCLPAAYGFPVKNETPVPETTSASPELACLSLRRPSKLCRVACRFVPFFVFTSCEVSALRLAGCKKGGFTMRKRFNSVRNKRKIGRLKNTTKVQK